MEKVRRTEYLFVYFDNIGFIDISQLLKGVARVTSHKQIFVLSILKKQAFPVTFKDLRLLFEIPSDKWVPAAEIIRRCKTNLEVLHDFARKGFILSDRNDECFLKLRRNDELLSSTQWNIYAALYHFMTRWHDMHLKIDFPKDMEKLKEVNAISEEVFKEFIKRYGKPPSHFHKISNPLSIYELPVIKKEEKFYEILLRRKTTRMFDTQTPMTVEEIATILYYVWGCHGYAPIFEDIVGLKKTSPSGGDLHPIEVYPLIHNVKGLDPGLYHYNTENHSLEFMVSMTQDEVAELANEFTAGQSYPRWAHALFIMTARFYRNFWKYRRHDKAYSVLFMDAAHLSQTFYLVCTELGLGAFITAAINSINIERKLGLDGITEGAMAICGCGKLLKKSELDPEFLPYMPREMKL